MGRKVAPGIGKVVVARIILYCLTGALEGCRGEVLGKFGGTLKAFDRLLLVGRGGLGALRLEKGNDRAKVKEPDCENHDEQEPASEEAWAFVSFLLPRLVAGRVAYIFDWAQIQHGSVVRNGVSVYCLGSNGASQIIHIY